MSSSLLDRKKLEKIVSKEFVKVVLDKFSKEGWRNYQEKIKPYLATAPLFSSLLADDLNNSSVIEFGRVDFSLYGILALQKKDFFAKPKISHVLRTTIGYALDSIGDKEIGKISVDKSDSSNADTIMYLEKIATSIACYEKSSSFTNEHTLNYCPMDWRSIHDAEDFTHKPLTHAVYFGVLKELAGESKNYHLFKAQLAKLLVGSSKLAPDAYFLDTDFDNKKIIKFFPEEIKLEVVNLTHKEMFTAKKMNSSYIKARNLFQMKSYDY